MSGPRRPILARSYLYVPGNAERKLCKAFDSSADAVILDLEDSVPPKEKQKARRMVTEVLRQHRKPEGPRAYVRINSMDTDLWLGDIAAAVHPSVHGICLPKADSGKQMRALDCALGEAEKSSGLKGGSLRVMPVVETAVGVLAALEIAKGARVESLSFGIVDFARDIGVEPDPCGLQTLHAQSHLVLVSRAAALIPPVAPVYSRIRDMKGLRDTSKVAKRLGFFGGACLHPLQIPVVHEVFTPSPAEVAEARAIIEAFNRAIAQGSGTLAMGRGVFVDKPVVERAQALIKLAEDLQWLPRK